MNELTELFKEYQELEYQFSQVLDTAANKSVRRAMERDLAKLADRIDSLELAL